MKSLLDRYKEGECEAVWHELLLLNQQTAPSRVMDNAAVQAVIQEMMERVKLNAQSIYRKLHGIGYSFDDSWMIPPGVAESVLSGTQIQEIEEKVGLLPLSLKTFYQIVGSINLIGSHGEIPLKSLADPLFVLPIDIATFDFEQWKEWGEEHGVENVGPYGINISPDRYHKANISGGESYKISLPSVSIDEILLNERNELYFTAYLRKSFLWGGFIGFSDSEIYPSELISYLTRDLLPI